jgi:homoserine O-acetyltransferase
MTDSVFASSDSQRSAQPLPHAQTFRSERPFKLTHGGILPSVTTVYETYGQLNTARDNAVLVFHAISGDSHVARHSAEDETGWWDVVVGPGKALDTDRFFVICANVLGGCRGSTGPNSIHPETGSPYGPDFPVVTIEDMVDAQTLLLDHLGIVQLLAVVGGSMGGHLALCWATRHPARVRGCVPIATSARLTSQALAFDVVARNAICRDPLFYGGHYYDRPEGPAVGLAIARMLGHITYLSPEAMAVKFDANKLRPRDVATEFEKSFSVGSYLAYQGDRFVERFDANSYITLSQAIDLFDLAGSADALQQVLARSRCHWLVLSFSSDWLFPVHQSREIVAALVAADRRVSFCNVTSRCGHDAFLLPDNVDSYGAMIGAFLCHEAGQSTPPVEMDDNGSERRPTSIFHQKRVDYDQIVELIEPDSRVLDLGCGNGELLTRLAVGNHARPLGVELDERAILACIQRGLDVIQADLNEGLDQFANQQFDYVALSQTLQSIVRTEAIVDAILRVGRRAIVSFPNFAYHKIRQALSEEGRSPASAEGLLHYAWYNTPNRRFLSVLDWEEFCAAKGIVIEQARFFDTESHGRIIDDPNRNADLAIYVIHR